LWKKKKRLYKLKKRKKKKKNINRESKERIKHKVMILSYIYRKIIYYEQILFFTRVINKILNISISKF